ncbi:endospore germination permease [Caldicoprobacter algeriensis]|uniref:GerAB/ArcD/ProY family transporter n=1 Tax=Caldicoprobacter algeriensis TaxID=699281 RepID=UPI00207A7DA5|nr:endospore germination permease [Caldicoprobacter algeriensis]MCM8900733.1 endospore germination permease [Caldicoprobacter algeriensis]
MEKARISSLQLFMLMTGFLFGSTLIINPIINAKNDGWLAIIIGGIGGTLLLWVYATIALLNPSKNFVEILRSRLGKVLGNLLALLYVWYFTHLASLVFRNFGSFITTTTYLYTPLEVIITIFAIVIVYAVNSGIEVVGRVSELLVPVIPVIAVLISISLVTIHDFTAFLPVLENGIQPVIKAAYAFLTFPFGETISFLMIFPHLNKRKNLRRVSALSALSVTGLFLFIFFRDITALGSHFIYQATFVPHITSVLIPGINLEPLLDVNLLIGGGIKIAICLYAASTMLANIIGADDYRKFTTSLLTFCVVLSIWIYENIFEMFNWAEKVWPYYSIPFQIFIPLILLVLSLIKKNKTTLTDSAEQ